MAFTLDELKAHYAQLPRIRRSRQSLRDVRSRRPERSDGARFGVSPRQGCLQALRSCWPGRSRHRCRLAGVLHRARPRGRGARGAKKRACREQHGVCRRSIPSLSTRLASKKARSTTPYVNSALNLFYDPAHVIKLIGRLLKPAGKLVSDGACHDAARQAGHGPGPRVRQRRSGSPSTERTSRVGCTTPAWTCPPTRH